MKEDLNEIVQRLLRKYDVVEIKKVNGQYQVIGLNRKLEQKITEIGR